MVNVSVTAPTMKEIERSVLEETTEDWKGLWELCSVLKTDLHLSASDAEIRSIITPAIKRMTNEGMLKFRRNKWAQKDFIVVSANEIDLLLAEPANWVAPTTKDSYSLWCAATKEGERHLRAIISHDSSN